MLKPQYINSAGTAAPRFFDSQNNGAPGDPMKLGFSPCRSTDRQGLAGPSLRADREDSCSRDQIGYTEAYCRRALRPTAPRTYVMHEVHSEPHHDTKTIQASAPAPSTCRTAPGGGRANIAIDSNHMLDGRSSSASAGGCCPTPKTSAIARPTGANVPEAINTVLAIWGARAALQHRRPILEDHNRDASTAGDRPGFLTRAAWQKPHPPIVVTGRRAVLTRRKRRPRRAAGSRSRRTS